MHAKQSGWPLWVSAELQLCCTLHKCTTTCTAQAVSQPLLVLLVALCRGHSWVKGYSHHTLQSVCVFGRDECTQVAVRHAFLCCAGDVLLAAFLQLQAPIESFSDLVLRVSSLTDGLVLHALRCLVGSPTGWWCLRHVSRPCAGCLLTDWAACWMCARCDRLVCFLLVVCFSLLCVSQVPLE
jgi:hypothetical protein